MADQSAHIDPVRVEAFAARLKSTVAYYHEKIDQLQSQLGRLNKSWQDQEFDLFAEEVQNLKQGLASYILEADKAHGRLRELAVMAREYQRTQL